MCGNGAAIGMAVIPHRHRPIPKGHHRGRTAWVVAVAGSTMRPIAGRRPATSTLQATATTILASAWSPPSKQWLILSFLLRLPCEIRSKFHGAIELCKKGVRDEQPKGKANINRLFAASRVLEIEQRFYQNEKGAYWSFCVRYLNGGKIKIFRKFRRILIGTNHV